MKRLRIVLTAITAMLVWLPIHSEAQGQGGGGGGGGGRGNFDPAQMRQRMMDRYKEMLDVDDAAWKAIEPRIAKVTDARREVGGGMRGMFGGGRRGGGGPGGADTQAQGDQQPRRNNFGPAPSAAATDLQKALDSKVSTEAIKAKLTAYRDEQKQKQAALVTAQEDLKKVLTLKQEAALVLAGLLD